MERQGVCKFCGQIRMIKGGVNMTQEELDKEAVLECDCPEAQFFQKKYDAKTYAIANIKELFAEESEQFRTFLIEAVEQISMGRIKKMTAVTEDGVKAEIVAKEIKIKVTRSFTDKRTLET